MTDSLSRPFLVGGERMKVGIPTPGRRHSKTPRFTYAEARERLLPQLAQLRTDAAEKTGLRTSEVVFRATLWPEYLAASYFPYHLLGETGLDVVGSQPARGEHVTPRRTKPDALTKTLFLAGSDADIGHLYAIVASQPPSDDADDHIWNDIRTLADVTMPTAAHVLQQSGAGGVVEDMAGADIHDFSTPAADHVTQQWECVLHRTADFTDALTLFGRLVAEAGGSTDINARVEAGGLVYVAAWLNRGAAQQLAAFNPLRAVRPLPAIRPVFQPMFRGIGETSVKPPADGSPLTEHRIAVFDGGIDPTCPVTSASVRLIDLTTTNPDAAAVEHGSIVTNAVLYGYVPQAEVLRRPEVGVDHYRVWPPPAGQANDPDLFWILREIRKVVESKKYRVVVLCLAPDQEVDDLTPHPWTALLDELAHEHGTLFVVAAGNRGEMPPETGLHRVQVPADMANALGVGAATARHLDGMKWDRASYSSYGPGRPGAIMQPLVLQFGGTIETPFVGVAANGARVMTMGTSFAAPLVGHAVGGALAALGAENASASFLRALAVHSSQRSRPHKPILHGFGRTLERFDSVWNCPPNEVTLLYSDVLERHTPVALPLPVPVGLSEDTVLRIRCTAAFQTRVAASDPVDYSLSAITWTFRPHLQVFTFSDGEDELIVDTRNDAQVEDLLANGWTPSTLPRSGQLNEFSSEEERRLTDGKWETVFQAWAQPTVANLHDPRIEFRYLAREDGRLQRGARVPALPFALLVTVTAPDDVPLYELVREQFQLLTPVQLDARVQV